MIRMHEISNKERVIVENIEDISSVKLGRLMNIIDLILPCVVCLFVFSLVQFRRRSFMSSKVNRIGVVSTRARFFTFIKVYLRFRKKIQEVLASPNSEFSCAILVSVLFCNRSGPEFSY